MKVETRAFFDKAARALTKAHIDLKAASTAPIMAEEAARHAYHAAFHAAQGLIFERSGKVLKSHSGVHSEFNRLVKDDGTIGRPLRAFLKKAYAFKSIADYETGSSLDITLARATEAITTAEYFVASIRRAITPDPSRNP